MAAVKKRKGRKRMGRPKGSGGPPEKVRRNRVTATLTDAELVVLERLADDRGLPVGTMLYELVKKTLARRKK